MNKQLQFLISLPAACALWCGSFLLAVLFPGAGSLFVLALASMNVLLALPWSHKWLQRIGFPLAFVMVLGLIAPRPVKAVLGIDFEQIAILLQQLAQLRQTYQNAVQIYQTTVQNYELAKRNLQALGSKDTYKAWGLSVLGSHVPNRYGELSGWNAAINNGVGIPGAYANATLPLSPHTDFLSRERLGSSAPLSNLARVGLIDSTSQNAMATISQILRQQSMNQSSVSQWERSIYSTSPELNTAAAQQNLTNLGMVQQYEQAKANLAVNGLLAQQFMIQNMKDRDATVSTLNLWQGMAESAATQPYALGGMADDLKTHSLF